jgi:hypothetical protein
LDFLNGLKGNVAMGGAMDEKDPFRRADRPGPNIVIVLDDLDRPGRVVAYRIANPARKGYGRDELEAVEDLERREKEEAP